MVRVKRGNVAAKRRKKILKLAKRKVSKQVWKALFFHFHKVFKERINAFRVGWGHVKTNIEFRTIPCMPYSISYIACNTKAPVNASRTQHDT